MDPEMKTRSPLLVTLFLLLATNSSTWAQSDLSDEEQVLWQMTNQSRQEQGLPPLAWDEKLAAAARIHSDEMAKHGKLSHQFEDEPPLKERLAAVELRFDAASENVAFAASAEQAQRGFLHSPGHRANMMDARYNAVGIGAAERDGVLYFTVDFARRQEVLVDADVEERVIRVLESERQKRRLDQSVAHPAPSLRNVACEGRTHALNAQHIGERYPQANWALAFTTVDAASVPAAALKAATERGLRRIEVGACFAPSSSNGYSTFWVVLLGY
jgi:uncharacterized protein YkwD